MKLVVLGLLLAFAANSFAEEAYIRTGDNRTMTKIRKDRVTGRLRELDVDDDDGTILCFGGDPDEVCDIIKAAVKEENDKENLPKLFKWKVSKCKFKNNKKHWVNMGGYLDFRASKVRTEEFNDVISDQLPLCSALDRIK